MEERIDVNFIDANLYKEIKEKRDEALRNNINSEMVEFYNALLDVFNDFIQKHK